MAPLIVSELCVRWKAEIQSFAIQWTIILNLLVMVYKIEVSRQYLKDLKLARKRQLDEKLLNDIIAMLAA